MKTRATIRLQFQTEKEAETIFESLKPETEHQTTIRSHMILQKEGENLTLKVEARDTVALRATLNAYLRWINSILNMFKVLEKQQSCTSGGSQDINLTE